MTEQEIYDAWTRYMHRNDLAGDMATTMAWARNRVQLSAMGNVAPLKGDLILRPLVYFHGGMMYLATLAADNEQMMVHMGEFERTLHASEMRQSIDQVDADPFTYGLPHSFLAVIAPGVPVSGAQRGFYRDPYGVNEPYGNLNPWDFSGFKLHEISSNGTTLRVGCEWRPPGATLQVVFGDIQCDLVRDQYDRFVGPDNGIRAAFIAGTDVPAPITITFTRD